MDLQKLEKLAKLVLAELPNGLGSAFTYNPDHATKFMNLMVVAQESLPEYKELFNGAYERSRLFDSRQARSIVKHLLEILELEKTSEMKIEQMKIFESAEEKLKQVNISFRKDDYMSTFHNLNTALELVLKDKLGIPATITGINTSNIMDVLTKYKVEPYLYLEEVRKHVLVIDNKIKHQGYCPSKIDCINGIKAMEELIAKLRNTDIELTEEIKNKIYEGL
jgi:HEPN domain-containing protein